MATEDSGQDDLMVLHEALLRGDNAARVALSEVLLSALRRRFGSRRDLEREDIESFIGEAITKYLGAPDDYDPAREPLLAYLYADADGDIRNEAAKRRRRPEVPVWGGEFELLSTPGNPSVEEQVVERLDPLDLPRSSVERALAAIQDLSDEERGFLQLRADGVRSTQAYAEVLGIAHLPAEQQRREVKRAKDRLDKRLGSIRGRLSQ
jgi:DNA-directed RNA polymerase specialized sigma24 family protein